jgi:hypothetical protein
MVLRPQQPVNRAFNVAQVRRNRYRRKHDERLGLPGLQRR